VACPGSGAVVQSCRVAERAHPPAVSCAVRRRGPQGLELGHNLPRPPHSKRCQRDRAVEVVVIIRAIARPPQLAHALPDCAVERARALAIVRDHQVMGVTSRRELSPLLVLGTPARRPVHGIIGPALAKVNFLAK
jgi:hypothetical protein